MKRTIGFSLCALAGAAGVMLASPSASAAENITIVQHNVEAQQPAIDAAIAKAMEVGATGITLQEVCADQAGAIYTQYGHLWSVNYATDNPQKPICGGQPGGTVSIWTRGAHGLAEDIPITPDGGRTPTLTCFSFGSAPVSHVCSAHLVAADDAGVRGQQTGDLKRITEPWINAGHAVFLGGDFNAGPNKEEMNKIYQLNGFGNFNEAAQLQTGGRGGAATTDDGRKIDYVFFSKNRTPASAPGSMQVFPSPSDHHILVGTAQVN